MAPRTIAAMSPCPSPCDSGHLHCSVRVLAFMAAEEMLNAGVCMMVEEEKLDGWEDKYVFQEHVAPLGKSSSKNRGGLMRGCYELSAAIFVTDRN